MEKRRAVWETRSFFHSELGLIFAPSQQKKGIGRISLRHQQRFTNRVWAATETSRTLPMGLVSFPIAPFHTPLPLLNPTCQTCLQTQSPCLSPPGSVNPAFRDVSLLDLCHLYCLSKVPAPPSPPPPPP